MPFASMPSLKKWKDASSVTFARRKNDPVLRQIDDLVKWYHEKPESQHEILYQAFRTTNYWLSNVGVEFKGSEKRAGHIADLNAYAKRELCRLFDVSDAEFNECMTLAFGKPVHVAYEDAEVYNEDRTVKYINLETQRREYKLVFRKGKAHKHKDGGLEAYDTNGETGKSGATGAAIFVMDGDGRIYTGSYERGMQHHSTFLAGGWVLSAGEMEVRDGQITSICPDSGHYQPGALQMLNVAERLRMGLVDMTQVEVRLFIYETDGPFVGQPKQKAGEYEWKRTRGDVFLATRGK